VVELVALDNADIKYSTVQNWYAGDENGVGGIYNFVTKRGCAGGVNSKISWTQVETGFCDHVEISFVRAARGQLDRRVLFGCADEPLSAGGHRHEDGAHRKNTRSTIISKGISAGTVEQQLSRPRENGGAGCRRPQLFAMRFDADRFEVLGEHLSYIQVNNPTAKVEHEATTSKIGEDQLFYFRQRGIGTEEAVSMIINGFCKQVFQQLPMEFAVEATKLLG
jgi:Fe-S cluster assembly protein SufB